MDPAAYGRKGSLRSDGDVPTVDYLLTGEEGVHGQRDVVSTVEIEAAGAGSDARRAEARARAVRRSRILRSV